MAASTTFGVIKYDLAGSDGVWSHDHGQGGVGLVLGAFWNPLALWNEIEGLVSLHLFEKDEEEKFWSNPDRCPIHIAALF